MTYSDDDVRRLVEMAGYALEHMRLSALPHGTLPKRYRGLEDALKPFHPDIEADAELIEIMARAIAGANSPSNNTELARAALAAYRTHTGETK